MNPSGGNFANGAIWRTIVFKVSAIYLFANVHSELNVHSEHNEKPAVCLNLALKQFFFELELFLHNE